MQTSRQAGAEPCWSMCNDHELHWESWGEQHAIFDSLSGETHLLPDLTAHVLRNLDNRVCTARQLAEALCAEMDEPCDEQFIKNITRTLQQLQAVELVEQSAP